MASDHQGEGSTVHIINNYGEEIVFQIGAEVETLGDVRREVTRKWNVPPFLQRLTCCKREYINFPHETPITEVLRGTDRHVRDGGQRIITVHWPRDDDYVDLSDDFEFIAKEEFSHIQQLRESEERPFEAVTVSAYRQIAQDVVKNFLEYQEGVAGTVDPPNKRKRKQV